MKPSVTPDSPQGVRRILAANVVSKAVVLGVSGVLAVFTTHLILQHFGVAAYAQYGLLASMTALIPFADLGMSAAVINAVAGSSSPRTDEHVRLTLLSALRVLIVSATVIIGIGVVISLLGLWPAILGKGLLPGGGTAALVCVIVFALTLPMGIGQRILTGLGKNHVQIRTQFIPAPLMLVFVVLMVLLHDKPSNALPVVSYVGGTLIAASSLYLAARYIAPQFGIALRDVRHYRSIPGGQVMNVAWPMLAQMIALPIAMQTDRLLLSHLAPTAELAQYNLASQLFGMITQTISTAGIALWPVFAKARTGDIRSPWGFTLGFLGGGVGLAALLGALLPWFAPLISGGRIILSPWLIVGFILFVGAQAAKYPLGMYMTDARGLRFQVLPIFVLVPVNLAISWALISPLGAAGPILGSAISVTLCQVLPNIWYVRRDLAQRRATPNLAVLASGVPASSSLDPGSEQK